VYELLRLYADTDGAARFAAEKIPFDPVEPAVHELSVATPWAANGAVLVQAPAGGSHPEQPEARRNLVVVLSGEVEVTASGETRVGRPGDVLLVEDTTGTGHSSRTATGFTALMIFID
jgi:quercetin dioxygenase-like cupin family protein